MNADVKRKMLGVLLDLYIGVRSAHPAYGLCGHLETRCVRVDYTALDRLFAAWPEYSGNMEYPVPSYDGLTPVAAYLSGGRWDTNTEYGRARWRLLWWCCTELMRELGEIQEIEPPPMPLDAVLADKVRALYVGAAISSGKEQA